MAHRSRRRAAGDGSPPQRGLWRRPRDVPPDPGRARYPMAEPHAHWTMGVGAPYGGGVRDFAMQSCARFAKGDPGLAPYAASQPFALEGVPVHGADGWRHDVYPHYRVEFPDEKAEADYSAWGHRGEVGEVLPDWPPYMSAVLTTLSGLSNRSVVYRTPALRVRGENVIDRRIRSNGLRLWDERVGDPAYLLLRYGGVDDGFRLVPLDGEERLGLDSILEWLWELGDAHAMEEDREEWLADQADSLPGSYGWAAGLVGWAHAFLTAVEEDPSILDADPDEEWAGFPHQLAEWEMDLLEGWVWAARRLLRLDLPRSPGPPGLFLVD